MNTNQIAVSLLLLTLAVAVGAEEEKATKNLTLITSLQSGQVVEGKYRGEDFQRGWLMNAKVELLAHAVFNEHLQATVGIAGKTWYNNFPWYRRKVVYNSAMEVPEKYFEFSITHGEGTYCFGDPQRPWLDIGVGIFPFKYNPNVRNLGEYLFRSGTYPGYLITDFDVPYSRLTGLRLSSIMFESLTHHVLFTMETDFRPFHDLTLSYLTSYNFRNIIEIGGGVSFAHLVSVYENYTHPTTTRDGDPARENSFPTPEGDTAFYTFRGTKVMGRMTLDPKRLFIDEGENGLFGPNDFKLYGEATLLGVHNYPSNNDTLFGRKAVHYDTLLQRIPIMAGFNVPTFRLLDVLALEVEWYGSKFPNSTSRVVTNGYPIPAQPEADYVTYDYSNDDWKWSLYAKKILVDGFSITAQAARDHFRTVTDFEQQKDREEALTKNNHWYWMVKAEFRL